MLCQDCNKKESSVHFKQVINNQTLDLHLCRECAEKRGFHSPFEGIPFPLAELLSGMREKFSKKESLKDNGVRCPGCGMALSDFAKIGRLGCGQCYATFRPQLLEMIEKIHGTTKHKGKTPSTSVEGMEPLKEERRLQEELQKAIDKEDFEKAAEIRDRINSMVRKR